MDTIKEAKVSMVLEVKYMVASTVTSNICSNQKHIYREEQGAETMERG